MLLYQITVRTGRFEVIKQSVASLTDDRRLQTLLIAFSFGAFLEGAAGFGAPVAISAGMLVGLGFDPYYAAGLCLIANTAPVAFGSIGIPLITASQVTGVDLHALSQMVGRQLPLLSLLVPFYLVALMAGRRGLRDVWPAALVSGGTFAIAQCLTANYLGPMLPDIISSVVSILALVLLLRVWHPAQSFRFASEPQQTTRPVALPLGKALAAWAPFLILTLMVGSWGVKSVQALVDQVTMRVPVPGLDGAIANSGHGARDRRGVPLQLARRVGHGGVPRRAALGGRRRCRAGGWLRRWRSTRASSSRGRWRRSRRSSRSRMSAARPA